jgi:hypothetical protein
LKLKEAEGNVMSCNFTQGQAFPFYFCLRNLKGIAVGQQAKTSKKKMGTWIK